MVEVALERALRLLLQLGILPPQSFHDVINKCRGLAWIKPTAHHPRLGDFAETICHQGGGTQTAQEKLLKGVALLHRQR